MNNPNKLTYGERAIEPKPAFNLGINHFMSKERRFAKQARHRANAQRRQQVSAQGPKGSQGR